MAVRWAAVSAAPVEVPRYRGEERGIGRSGVGHRIGEADDRQQPVEDSGVAVGDGVLHDRPA